MRHGSEPDSARRRRSGSGNANGGECAEVAEDFPGAAPSVTARRPTAL